jgi:hypothetical protein
MKNEAPYVREWIEYYRLLGATRFYLYDNDSEDNVKEVIRSYIEAGVVVYKHLPGKHRQIEAYSDAIDNHASKTRFMAVVDLDEFIVPVDGDLTLPDVLRKIVALKPCAAGVAIPWVMYGSSHNKTRPSGLVIENYVHRADDSFTFVIKTVFNPRLAMGCNNPHYPIYKYGACSINENGHIVVGKVDIGRSLRHIRVNHYFTKSEEEFGAKIAKGTADRYLRRSAANFVQWDRNEIYDGIMLRYAPQIKRNLQGVAVDAGDDRAVQV